MIIMFKLGWFHYLSTCAMLYLIYSLFIFNNIAYLSSICRVFSYLDSYLEGGEEKRREWGGIWGWKRGWEKGRWGENIRVFICDGNS